MQVQVQVAVALQLAPRSRLHSVDTLHPLRFLSSVLGQWGAAGEIRLLQCNASRQLQVARPPSDTHKRVRSERGSVVS